MGKSRVDLLAATRKTCGMLDVTEPEVIEILINNTGKVVWINGPDGCLFRACRIKKLILNDEREL